MGLSRAFTKSKGEVQWPKSKDYKAKLFCKNYRRQGSFKDSNQTKPAAKDGTLLCEGQLVCVTCHSLLIRIGIESVSNT